MAQRGWPRKYKSGVYSTGSRTIDTGQKWEISLGPNGFSAEQSPGNLASRAEMQELLESAGPEALACESFWADTFDELLDKSRRGESMESLLSPWTRKDLVDDMIASDPRWEQFIVGENASKKPELATPARVRKKPADNADTRTAEKKDRGQQQATPKQATPKQATPKKESRRKAARPSPRPGTSSPKGTKTAATKSGRRKP